MRKLLIALAFAALPALADDVAQRIAEGTALFDQQKYDEAIAVFQSILKEQPDQPSALYELGLTYAAKGDFARCRAVLEPATRLQGPTQKLIYSVLGSCLDELGETKKSIAIMRQGLALEPGDPQLSFNLAITLAREGKNEEAIALLKQELEARPGHASGHYTLANLFSAQHFRVAAAVEYLRFLAVEPSGPRAKESAGRLLELLDLGVVKKSDKETSVTVDPDEPKGEGDYSSMAMGMAVASAGRFTEDKAKLTEPFAAVALLSLHLDGMQEWAQAYADDVDKFLVWMRAHREKPPIPIQPAAPAKPVA